MRTVLCLAVACQAIAVHWGDAPQYDDFVIEDIDECDPSAEDEGCPATDVQGSPAAMWTVAFGSCHHQHKPAPGLASAAQSAPDVFVFLGDNLYNDVDRWDMPCRPGSCSGILRGLFARLAWAAFHLIPDSLKKGIASRVARSHNAQASPRDVQALRANYAALGAKVEVRLIREVVPSVVATWDDHDLGRNDNGASYLHKGEAAQEFLRFWRGEGASEGREGRGGVYEAYVYGKGERSAQVILLDLRSFRTDLVPSTAVTASSDACRAPDGDRGFGEYCRDVRENATLLGEEQWAWLEERLLEPVGMHVVGSSLALASEFHGMEAWVRRERRALARSGCEGAAVKGSRRRRIRTRLADVRACDPPSCGLTSVALRSSHTTIQSLFPLEQQRLVNLIKRTRAERIIVISGDVHYAELSVLHEKGLYPIYDLTSSGLTQSWPLVPSNANRIAGPISANNWGRVAVDWAKREVDLDVLDAQGALRLHRTVNLDDLRMPPDEAPGTSRS